MNSVAPSRAKIPEEPRALEAPHCDLCGSDLRPNEMTEAAYDASGLFICIPCIEDSLS